MENDLNSNIISLSSSSTYIEKNSFIQFLQKDFEEA